jgi:hypothetical protein
MDQSFSAVMAGMEVVVQNVMSAAIDMADLKANAKNMPID